MERISFNGFENKYLTFKCAENISTGKAVNLDDDGKAINGVEGDGIFGFSAGMREGTITVQIKGYIETKFSGDMICGVQSLVYDSSGGVRLSESGENGSLVKVVKFDDDTKIAGFIFN